ncbi:cadherin-like domain-containing protein [Sphaerotilus sp.]|jgi:Cadherin-like/Right handed beta helix region|uniref:cadherin-like domain-containing protein n=1 Tax=Sphaerotilus sp. TaxID=2093942 RepID=UPI0025CD2864|nr:cadherin-like domain-containing protein [Sphaerotilus sp.]
MTRPPRRRWQCEELEPRILYAADTAALTGLANLGDIGTTFLVSTTADSGAGSLRDAITQANLHPGADTIRFDIREPLVNGAHTITPRSALPVITDTVWLDASREPDALALGHPVVELVGTDAGGSTAALVLADGADGSLVRGLVIHEFGGAGIQVRAGADGVVLAGLRIGTDVTGLRAPGNGGNAIETSAAQTLIGGANPADRNLLSGNNAGVQATGAAATGTRIEGNFIGTDARGESALGNRTVGVYLDAPDATVVGNLVSGNGFEGVYLLAGAGGSTVQGNLIGTDLSGTRAVGNGSFGVYVENTRDVLIGGTAPGAGNLIAWQKSGAGISIVGVAGGVSVLGNAIHDNAGLGIDLGAEGVNGNREADTDGGPNNLLNYPVLDSATVQAGATRLLGTVTMAAGTTLRIEFFVSPQADPLGFGEGRTFLGSARVTADASGLARIDTVLAGVLLQAGQVVSATATVQLAGAAASPKPWGDSSEFGNAVVVQVVPSAPVVEPAQILHIAENSPADTVVGTLRASDADPGSVLSGWTITGSSALAIDAATGTVRVVDPATLDHERSLSITLTATVSDGVGGSGLTSAPQTLTVFIDDVNEPPVLTLAPWKIQTGAPLTLDPAVLGAQDPEGNTAALLVEVGATTGGRFEAVGAPGVALDRFSVAALQSGQIRFVATALSQAPTVSLRVSDGSTTSAWTTVGVDWTPAPPAPAPAPAPAPLDPTPVLTISDPVSRDSTTTAPPTLDVPALSGDRGPLSREVRAVAAEQWLAQVQATSSAEIAALNAHIRSDSARPPGTPHTSDAAPAPDLLALVMPDTALATLQAGYDLPATVARGGELSALADDGLGLLRTDLADEAGRLQSAIDPIEASGLALTVGLVWWTVRLGGVAGSLLVSVPTWQFFDPLPVLTRPPRPLPSPQRRSDPAGPDLHNEEASAAEVLGRDASAAVREAPEADDSVDAPAAGKGARR